MCAIDISLLNTLMTNSVGVCANASLCENHTFSTNDFYSIKIPTVLALGFRFLFLDCTAKKNMNRFRDYWIVCSFWAYFGHCFWGECAMLVSCAFGLLSRLHCALNRLFFLLNFVRMHKTVCTGIAGALGGMSNKHFDFYCSSEAMAYAVGFVWSIYSMCVYATNAPLSVIIFSLFFHKWKYQKNPNPNSQVIKSSA